MKIEFTSAQAAAMQTALDKWGLAAQAGQTVEECAELIVALQKQFNRTPTPETIENIVDEIADVEMMLAQMRLAFDVDEKDFHERINAKFNKLNKYLSGAINNERKDFMITVRKPSESEKAEMLTKPTWGCEVSEFNWHYDNEETCLLIEGEVTVTYDDGSVL